MLINKGLALRPNKDMGDKRPTTNFHSWRRRGGRWETCSDWYYRRQLNRLIHVVRFSKMASNTRGRRSHYSFDIWPYSLTRELAKRNNIHTMHVYKWPFLHHVSKKAIFYFVLYHTTFICHHQLQLNKKIQYKIWKIYIVFIPTIA